ncbi:hypothetical protein LV84_00392 [Algoriphagus ratkowskyi]|uniref:Uncharacterized protein n=1 Tax=Algoriphagus ratkowskyi TaxID=57028 RepID=A0A2W7RGQ6_9BACT|nr:hypothetical protein LV84_00392 [Algoriphagus ratkowskyi]
MIDKVILMFIILILDCTFIKLSLGYGIPANVYSSVNQFDSELLVYR